MTLVVEDGTGTNSPKADSYNSLDEIQAYADDHGLTFATSPTEPAEAAARRAAVWLDATYRDRLPGTRTNGRQQGLAWPRTGATDIDGNEIADDEIPAEWKAAHAEATIKELASPGTLSPDLERGGDIKRMKAGSVEIEYKDGAPATTIFSAIDSILSGLIVTKKSSTVVGFSARA
jgi:hypothetical protein